MKSMFLFLLAALVCFTFAQYSSTGLHDLHHGLDAPYVKQDEGDELLAIDTLGSNQEDQDEDGDGFTGSNHGGHYGQGRQGGRYRWQQRRNGQGLVEVDAGNVNTDGESSDDDLDTVMGYGQDQDTRGYGHHRRGRPWRRVHRRMQQRSDRLGLPHHVNFNHGPRVRLQRRMRGLGMVADLNPFTDTVRESESILLTDRDSDDADVEHERGGQGNIDSVLTGPERPLSLRPGVRRRYGRRRPWQSRRRQGQTSGSFGLTASLNIPDWNFSGILTGIHRAGRWWRGPNVCVSTETNNQKKSSPDFGFVINQSYHCLDKTTSYRCKAEVERDGWKNVTLLTYRCCPGHVRDVRDHGCPGQVDLLGTEETIRALGISEFLKAMNESSMMSILEAHNVTLFVPTDQVFSGYIPEQIDLTNYIVLSSEEQAAIISEGRHLLEGHIVPNQLLYSSDLRNDRILETADPDSKIRINKYPNNVVTANCAKLSTVDTLSTNGIVHLVNDLVIQQRGTIYDFIKSNVNLRILFETLKNSSLSTNLRAAGGHFTIFAPSDTAFSKLRPSIRKRLVEDKELGGLCLSNVLAGHVFPKVLCSAGLANGSVQTDLLGHHVTFRRDEQNNLFINDVKVSVEEYMTENGVVHIIDNVITTGVMALDVAEKKGASKVVSMFNAAQLDAFVNGLDNVTLFLPTNEALQSIPNEERTVEELQTLLKYHIAAGTHSASQLTNNTPLRTLAGPQHLLWVTNTTAVRNTRRFGLMRRPSVKSVQCARLVTQDLWTCSGRTVVHLIDKLLVPPIGTILDTLEQDPARYGSFLALIKRPGLSSIIGLLTGNSHGLTLFVPSNQVLDNMPAHVKRQLTNVNKLKTFIGQHIVTVPVCCSSARGGFWRSALRLRSLAGGVLPWKRAANGMGVKIGQVSVTSCDISATNGVIHVIDGYLGPRRQRQSHALAGIDWPDFNMDDVFDLIAEF